MNQWLNCSEKKGEGKRSAPETGRSEDPRRRRTAMGLYSKVPKKHSLAHNKIDVILKELERSSSKQRKRALRAYQKVYKENPSDDIKRIIGKNTNFG